MELTKEIIEELAVKFVDDCSNDKEQEIELDLGHGHIYLTAILSWEQEYKIWTDRFIEPEYIISDILATVKDITYIDKNYNETEYGIKEDTEMEMALIEELRE